MSKFQETDTMSDVDSLMFQISKIIHSEAGNIESTLMDTLYGNHLNLY